MRSSTDVNEVSAQNTDLPNQPYPTALQSYEQIELSDVLPNYSPLTNIQLPSQNQFLRSQTTLKSNEEAIIKLIRKLIKIKKKIFVVMFLLTAFIVFCCIFWGIRSFQQFSFVKPDALKSNLAETGLIEFENYLITEKQNRTVIELDFNNLGWGKDSDGVSFTAAYPSIPVPSMKYYTTIAANKMTYVYDLSTLSNIDMDWYGISAPDFIEGEMFVLANLGLSLPFDGPVIPTFDRNFNGLEVPIPHSYSLYDDEIKMIQTVCKKNVQYEVPVDEINNITTTVTIYNTINIGCSWYFKKLLNGTRTIQAMPIAILEAGILKYDHVALPLYSSSPHAGIKVSYPPIRLGKKFVSYGVIFEIKCNEEVDKPRLRTSETPIIRNNLQYH
ncbi:hypothetical protein HK099_004678 [Clydaea vesicula]|uniref:Uncharacterized protein n=1 Tax=Clydaea vesicula TaxID=447962 RepID=A0AAD5U0F8_9FUNG|nr:hypothetical protein HK099_004678 [Clydaea vesicula]